MKITVIGHLCLDTIHHSGTDKEKKDEQQFGGIVYSIATLAALASPNDSIIPVFGVGKNDHDRLQTWFSQYPNIDPSGVYLLEGPTNEVHLHYQPGETGRTECSLNIAPPIPFDRLKPHLNSDAILINMISGFDITLETLDRIRMEVRDRGTPVHFDFHSLTLGLDPAAQRFRRALSDWRRWCFMLHSIQMSEEEAAGLTAERYDETGLINQLMPLMVNTLIITRGDRGATIVQQSHKKLTRRDLPAAEAGAIDPTGCGDVFGAAYLFRYVQTRDSSEAAAFANRVAAFNSTFPGPDGLHRLPEYLKQFETTKV